MYPYHLRKLLGLGFPLGPSCAALGEAPLRKATTEGAVAHLLDLHEGPLLSPPACFRGKVTDLLRTIDLSRKREHHALTLCSLVEEIGELETEIKGGLLSPSATPPGSPQRMSSQLPLVEALPALVLSGGTAIRSSSAESQIRIMKQLLDDGVLQPTACSVAVSQLRREAYCSVLRQPKS